MHYDTTQDERLMAMLAYLLAFPTLFVGPLIIYLIKKDQSRFVAFHALQALLLHLLLYAVGAVFGILGLVLGFVGLGLVMAPVGCLLMPALGLAVAIIKIIGLVRSYAGQWYVAPVVGPIAQGIAGV
jgi:uncharacterized protein